MDRDEPRSAQAPLKERYEQEPAATLLKLTGRYSVVSQTLARPPRLSAELSGV